MNHTSIHVCPLRPCIRYDITNLDKGDSEIWPFSKISGQRAMSEGKSLKKLSSMLTKVKKASPAPFINYFSPRMTTLMARPRLMNLQTSITMPATHANESR